ncbi:MAG: hypothetical protein EBU31_13010, partial [Proteobacteria bacterium]|nr:hypothetical protein [Pseudomonadota bacterium]
MRATHQVEARANVIAGERSDHLERAAAAFGRIEERGHQRLRDRHGAVGGAGVAPVLQEVRHRDVPGAARGARRLVDAVGEVHHGLGLGHRGGEAEVGGRIEHGVRAEHHQRVDGARVERGRHLLDAGDALLGVGAGGLDGAAVRAELGVDGGSHGVRGGGLARTGDHERLAAGLLQVVDERV